MNMYDLHEKTIILCIKMYTSTLQLTYLKIWNVRCMVWMYVCMYDVVWICMGWMCVCTTYGVNTFCTYWILWRVTPWNIQAVFISCKMLCVFFVTKVEIKCPILFSKTSFLIIHWKISTFSKISKIIKINKINKIIKSN